MRVRTDPDRGLFHWVAPFFGLAYPWQKRYYQKVLDRLEKELDLSTCRKVLDVGCGTGAFCSVLAERGFAVTGIDPVARMLDIAARRQTSGEVRFLQASILERLPFAEKSFDFSLASYVAHILPAGDREIMYKEMSRVSRHWVLLYDYNQKRSLKTDLIERLEGGDYFAFIRQVEGELKTSFRSWQRLDVDVQTAWYICRPY